MTLSCLAEGAQVSALHSGEPLGPSQQAHPEVRRHNEQVCFGRAGLRTQSSTHIAFSADEERAYVDEQGSAVMVWDLRERRLLRSLGVGDARLSGFSLSPDERFVAVALSHQIKTLRADSGAVVGHYGPNSPGFLDAPVWSPCGRWVVVARTDPSEQSGHYTIHRLRW